MKNVLLLFILSLPLVFAACSKKEGCRDADAINFDSSAEKDGTCQYTKVIFYAPGDMVGGNGNKVVKIEILRGPTPGEELIGTITELNQENPSACVAPQGAFEYELPGGGVEYIFLTRYYYNDNTNEAGDSYFITASRDNECEQIRLTL